MNTKWRKSLLIFSIISSVFLMGTANAAHHYHHTNYHHYNNYHHYHHGYYGYGSGFYGRGISVQFGPGYYGNYYNSNCKWVGGYWYRGYWHPAHRECYQY